MEVFVRPAGSSSPSVASGLMKDGGDRALRTVVLPLLVVAAAAWIATSRAGGMDVLGAASFTAAWMIMMVAMMLPAVAPVVGLYAMAAGRGSVAAVPFFLSGYAAVWALSAAPALAISRAVSTPLMEGRSWVARLVGLTLTIAAAYQMTPLKQRCLRACRSPMSFFLYRRSSLERPSAALLAGVQHGLFCFGCCWALMAVLVVLGGMQLGWAMTLALVISAEKLAPQSRSVVRAAAGACLLLGGALLISPSLLTHLIRT